MIKREESRHDFAFIAGVVIGAVTGALVALAMAPRTGTDTRDRWRSRIDEMPIDNLRARAMTLREAAASGTERLREAASGATATGVVETTRLKVTELIDKSPLPVTLGPESASEAAESAGETLADAASVAEDRLTGEFAGGSSEAGRQEGDLPAAVPGPAIDAAETEDDESRT